MALIRVDGDHKSRPGGRDHDAWGCLFGVSNEANFKPLVGLRGMAADASAEVRGFVEDFRARYPQEPIDCSWVTWKEIQNMDLDEQALTYHLSLFVYARGADGRLVRREAFGRPELADTAIVIQHLPDQQDAIWDAAMAIALERRYPEGALTEWEIDGTVYRRERMRRRDTFDDEWHTVLDLMRLLAHRHGPDGVRLSVYFSG